MVLPVWLENGLATLLFTKIENARESGRELNNKENEAASASVALSLNRSRGQQGDI